MLFYGATFWGIAHAGAGLTAVLANTDPLFVVALAGCAGRPTRSAARWRTPGALGAREAGLVAGLALVGSAAPATLFYLALARAPAAEVSAWFCLVPAVGVATAWPLLGEEPGARLGLAAASAGLWLVLRGAARGAARLVDSAAPR